jgi:hypothetical protein
MNIHGLRSYAPGLILPEMAGIYKRGVAGKGGLGLYLGDEERSRYGSSKGIFDGRVFTPEEPIKLAKNTTVTPSFSEDVPEQAVESPYRITAAEKRLRDAAETAYLNANAECLNAEIADVLQYQKDLF